MTILPVSAFIPTIESRTALRQFADLLPHLCWIADQRGNRRWFNQRWIAYTGLTADQAKGSGWQAAIEPADLPAFLNGWRECAEASLEFETGVHIRGADGIARAFVTRAIPLQDDSGEEFWLGTDTDIRRSDEARTHALEEAHEAREIADLLNSMSRVLTSELDTPKLTQKITDFATELTGAECGVFLHNLMDEKEEAHSLYTFSGAPREAFANLPSAFKGECLTRSADINQDPLHGTNTPFAMRAGYPPVRSYLAAPARGFSAASTSATAAPSAPTRS